MFHCLDFMKQVMHAHTGMLDVPVKAVQREVCSSILA